MSTGGPGFFVLLHNNVRLGYLRPLGPSEFEFYEVWNPDVWASLVSTTKWMTPTEVLMAHESMSLRKLVKSPSSGQMRDQEYDINDTAIVPIGNDFIPCGAQYLLPKRFLWFKPQQLEVKSTTMSKALFLT